jgi:hypothetical protein
MDLRDPKFWKDAFAVVVTEWPVVVPLVGLTSWVTWWVRGTMNKAVIDGLKATIDEKNVTANNLRSQNDVLNERLLLAQEKRAEITEKVASLEASMSPFRYVIFVTLKRSWKTKWDLSGSDLDNVART